MKADDIILKIKRFVNTLFSSKKLSLPAGKAAIACLETFCITAYPVFYTCVLVRWIPPAISWIKLNYDGASPGNPGPSRGGGVYRSHKGSILLAYCDFYDVISSLIAKTRAMLFGLKLLDNSSFVIWLELDSLILVQILRGEIHCPWHIYYYVHVIRAYLQKCTHKITHIYRESNSVADGLANEAIDCQHSKLFHNLERLPKHISRAAVLDMTSLPAIQA